MATPRLIPIPKHLRRPELVQRLPQGPSFRDRSGETLNGSKVLGYAGVLPPNFSAWLCRCDCGGLFIASSNRLNRRTVGCGCGTYKHRLSGAQIYSVWWDMLRRCNDPRHRSYHRHGALGITVCRQWRKSLEQFAADVGTRPSADHVFERVNIAGNFTPRNSRWIKRSDSRVRGHMRRFIEYNGQRLGVKDWAEKLRISRQALNNRIRRCRELGVDISVAVATPARARMAAIVAPASAKRRSTRNNQTE